MKTNKLQEFESTLILGGGSTQNPEPDRQNDLPAVVAQAALVPGSRLDHYLIEGQVGVGGMGVVHKAHDTLLDRKVALKILPPHLCENPDFVRRFANEARVQARIDSPHVVTLHALMEKELGLVLVMEYLEGETLEQRLRHQGPLSVKEAIDMFDQASLGVKHIHLMGIVHQDLKPANIFMTADGRIKLLDFGVAKLIDDQGVAQGGTMIGTLLYISPEQIKGREVDFRSDIYTLGVTLFEAVTGRLPFERKTNYALMHAHVQENPPPPRKYQAEIPRELEKVILKAIAKEPNRRFQTITDFRRALLRHRLSRRTSFGAEPALMPPTRSTPGALTHYRANDFGQAAAKRTLLGSFAFDGLLLVAIAALLVFLGLHPQDFFKPADSPTAPDTPQIQPSQNDFAPFSKIWGNR